MMSQNTNNNQEDNISLLDSIEEQVVQMKSNVNHRTTFNNGTPEFNMKIESLRAQVQLDSALLQQKISLIRAYVEGVPLPHSNSKYSNVNK